MYNYQQYEETLLSQIITNPDIIDGLLIRSSIFQDTSYREIFLAVDRARNKGKKIDSLMIIDELSTNHSDLVKIFTNITPCFTTGNADYYVKRLKERNMRGDLVKSFTIGLEESQDETKTALEIAEVVEKKIAEAMRGSEIIKSPAVKDYVEEAKKNLSEKRNDRINGNIKTISFGISGLNEYVGNIHPGEVVAIGARPSVGKSAMGLQIMVNIGYKHQKPALFISLEMGKQDLMERMAAMIAEIPYGGIRDGAINEQQEKTVDSAFDELGNLNMGIIDASEERLNLQIVKSYIRRERSIRGIEAVIIDYLGLLDVDDGRRARWERMVEITNSLKLLARELNIVIIELAQLTRLADGVEPTMASLRDSGSVEQDADRIILLHPTSAYNNFGIRQIKAIAAKNRHGKIGEVLLSFDGNTQFFKQEEKGD